MQVLVGLAGAYVIISLVIWVSLLYLAYDHFQGWRIPRKVFLLSTFFSIFWLPTMLYLVWRMYEEALCSF